VDAAYDAMSSDVELRNADGALRGSFRVPSGFAATDPAGFALSDDGRVLAIVEREGSILVLDGDGRERYAIRDEGGLCLSLAMSPDGRRLAALVRSGDLSFGSTYLRMWHLDPVAALAEASAIEIAPPSPASLAPYRELLVTPSVR
jgi:hypothetical protein